MTPFTYVAIPCADFERAFAFYSALLQVPLQRHPNVPFPMAYVHEQCGRVVGHLFQLSGFQPGGMGPIVYLRCDEELTSCLDRIVMAGGTVVMPATSLGPGKGEWAMFRDTEGNRLALHR